MKLRQFTVVLALGILMLFPASDAMANPIEIQFWHAQRPPRENTLNKIVEAYNKSQTKYQVVASFKGSYDETLNAGIAAFRSKKQPHILQVYEVGTQTMMLSNAIYPVFNLMKDTGHNIDWKSYLQPVLSYYVSSNGELQSMPFNSSTPIMYYNKDLFKKAGLTGPPRTWDEMGEYTKKLVASGTEYGMASAWQTWVMIENYSAIQNIPLATKSNGFDGLDTELTINNPMVVKHIERLKSWMDDKRFVYEEREYKGPEAAFISGKCAILMDSIGAIGAVKSAKFDWGAAPLPVEASMKEPQNSIIGGASLWVLKGLPQEEYQGVADFLAFQASEEMQIIWHKETGYLPITLQAYNKLKADGFYLQEPIQEVGILQLTRKDPTANSRGIRLGSFSQIRDVMNEELEMLWQGKKTAKQALDEAVSRGNDILRQFEKRSK
ncbi:MAG: sn-glycerol-3-phosphate ABC transporter substrate-binding protein UgpB [Deltaproteobacteria bacterium]|jgi:sn-glycerol 3-phosphate transport system substrate-binding protein